MSTKIIGLVGIEKYDIVRGLSCMLKGMGNRVLVVDMTRLQHTMNSIPAFAHQGLVEFGEVHFGGGLAVAEVNTWIADGNYDYILLDADLGEELLRSFACDRMFYITDCLKNHIDCIGEQICFSRNHSILVIRDMVFPNMIRSYLQTLLVAGVSEEQIILIQENLNERIWRLKMPCQYHLLTKAMSKQYMQLFYQLLSTIIPIKEKEYTKLLKQIGRSRR